MNYAFIKILVGLCTYRPENVKKQWLCYAARGILCHDIGTLVSVKGRITANLYDAFMIDYFYPMMKYSYPG